MSPEGIAKASCARFSRFASPLFGAISSHQERMLRCNLEVLTINLLSLSVLTCSALFRSFRAGGHNDDRKNHNRYFAGVGVSIKCCKCMRTTRRPGGGRVSVRRTRFIRAAGWEMIKSGVLIALFALAAASIAEARGGGGRGGRVSYGGGHHTSSHGGSYMSGQGSSHKGGSYNNARTGNSYGTHK